MDDLSASISIKTSRNGQIVPVISGIHMHSMYDPLKEASDFALSFENILLKKNNILVLGLGYGYHIAELIKKLKQTHSKYQVIVIEPNSRLVKLFKDNQIEQLNFKIYSMDIETLYKNKEFIHFLSQKPAIIKHDPSYHLNNIYFKKLLTYKADQQIFSYIDEIENKDIKEYLSNYSSTSFEQIIKKLEASNQVSRREELILLSLAELKKYQEKGL